MISPRMWAQDMCLNLNRCQPCADGIMCLHAQTVGDRIVEFVSQARKEERARCAQMTAMIEASTRQWEAFFERAPL